MDNINITIEKGVNLPAYKSKLAVGFDVQATKILKAFKGDVEEVEKLEKIQNAFQERGKLKIRPYERILFGTGIRADIPNNMELQVRPRSGVALEKGLIISNSPGTIDPDFVGEIGIIIYNSTPFLTTVVLNERIAQLVPKEVIRPQIKIIEVIEKQTERGENGYGSTGTH